MESYRFKNTQSYKQRLKYLLENTYSAENVIAVIDSIAEIYRPEMQRQVDRWNYPKSVEDWEKTIEDFKLFATQRPDFVWNNFLIFFPNIYSNPQKVKLQPNPANEKLLIDIPDSFEGNIHFQIFGMDGRRVGEQILSNEFQNEIDVSDLPIGVYVIYIFDKKQNYAERLVISH